MEEKLKDIIRGKNIIIWGARIVGIGLSRKCKKESIEVVSFVDSDESLSHREINGVKIKHPKELKKIIKDNGGKKIAIIVAVSIKEEEIRNYLKKSGIDKNVEIIYYKDYNNVYYTVDIVSSCNLACLSCAHSLEEEKARRDDENRKCE